MSNKVFGYIRVSSKDQNIDRQLIDMTNLGVNERDIFVDNMSGKDFNRPRYQALKQCLRENDLLYIKSIDRFGRNSSEIRKEWKDITKNIGANIKVIDMPMLDTTQFKDSSANEGSIGNFVADLVLQVLSFIAENERETIRQRQAEGISAAKLAGKHLGRPQLNLNSLNKNQHEILKRNYSRWNNGEITGVSFMTMLDLKKNTFYKIMKEYETLVKK